MMITFVSGSCEGICDAIQRSFLVGTVHFISVRGLCSITVLDLPWDADFLSASKHDITRL